MIVELSANDVTRISMGETVEIGGVTISLSLSLTESIANGVESLPRADTAKRLPIFKMHAKYDGRCKTCSVFLKKGGPIVYDSVQKRSMCMNCGSSVLAAFQRETATGV